MHSPSILIIIRIGLISQLGPVPSLHQLLQVRYRVDKNRVDKNRIDGNRVDGNRIGWNRIKRNRLDTEIGTDSPTGKPFI